MNREDIKIGMRVVAVSDVDGNTACIGLPGTVKELSKGMFDLGVEFDESFIGGHGMCGKSGRCRFGFASSFEPYYEEMTDEEHVYDVEFSFNKLMNGEIGI